MDRNHTNRGIELARALKSNRTEVALQAFEEIWARYRRGLESFACRMGSPAEHAEDRAQEALLDLWESRAQLQAPEALVTYLYTLCRFRCIRAWKQSRRQPATMSDEHLERHGRETGFEEAVLERYEEAQAHGVVRSQVEAVESPNHREALRLRAELKLGYAEIAVRLRVPVGTVKTWVHRARQQLRGR